MTDTMTDEQYIKWMDNLPLSERWKIGLPEKYNKPPPKRTTINENDLICLSQKLKMSEGKWDIDLFIDYSNIDKEAFFKYALLYLSEMINKKIESDNQYVEEEDYDE